MRGNWRRSVVWGRLTRVVELSLVVVGLVPACGAALGPGAEKIHRTVEAIVATEDGGSALTRTMHGARLTCWSHQLEGDVTPAGLWLISKTTDGAAEMFSVRAVGVGRGDIGFASRTFPARGAVEVLPTHARWIRPGLVEEYFVSPTGVRQDFVLAERPAGTGAMRLDLDISGATAEASADGARLVLDGSGRAVAYTRLKVLDAVGHEFPARIEVVSATRLCVLVEEVGALYPLRIDPTFVSEPSALAVTRGAPAAFSVHATGTGTLTYQWKKDGVPISGATSEGYMIRSIDYGDAGTYTVDVTDSGGVSTSSGATLDVNAPVGGDLDFGFYATNALNHYVHSFAIQPDGKMLIGGEFAVVDGVRRGGIARLNPDGSTDYSFGYGLTGANDVFAVALQSDGRVILGGNFASVNGTARGGIARLRADGTLDTSFANGVSGIAVGDHVLSVAIQSDGKVLIGGDINSVNGTARGGIARLHANGTLDTSFGNGLAGVNGWIRAVRLQSDGKVVIGGVFSTVNGTARLNIARLNADGTLDTSFGNGLAGANGEVHAVTLQADGKIVIGGKFFSVNGVARGRVARLHTDGTLDTTFGAALAGADNTVHAVAMQSDGKVLLAGEFINVNDTACGRLARLEVDGTLDPGFGAGLSGADAVVVSAHLQADGKVLVSGAFSTIHGIARTYLARLHADATVDAGFVHGGAPAMSGIVESLALQDDGKVLVGGQFTKFGGMVRKKLARVHSDGTLDMSFGIGSAGVSLGSSVNAISLQSDGKIVIGGKFSEVEGVAQGNLARLHANGSLDTAFGNGLAGANSTVSATAVQSDGKILIGGGFTAVNGTARGAIARLNADGTLDATFGNGLAGANSSISDLALQSDGKIVIGGSFATVNGSARVRVARLNADGTLDTSFGSGLAGAGGTVSAVALQSDGKVVIGGSFTTVNGVARGRVARLNADGTLDASFGNGLAGADNTIAALQIQSDGRVLIGGRFDYVNGVPRDQLARLEGFDRTPGVAVTAGALAFGAVTTNTVSAVQNYSVSGSNLVADVLVTAPAGFEVSTASGSGFGSGLSLPVTGETLSPTTIYVRFVPTLIQAYAGSITHSSPGAATENKAVSGTGTGMPEIGVEQPAGTDLADGTASIGFGSLGVGMSSAAMTFTVINSGDGPLSGLAISQDGLHPGDFTVGALGATTLAPSASTTFTVTFTPSAAGARSAVMHLASNDADENPFDIALSGTGVNTPPIAAFNLAPNPALEGQDVTLNASASFDPDPGDPITSYAWDLDNDGLYDDAVGVNTTITTLDNGAMTIGLQVADANGGANTASAVLTTLNVAPVLNAGPDQAVGLGRAVYLPPAVFTDPGPVDTFTATIDWGDGNSEPGAVNTSTRRISGSHTYAALGVYSVTVTVTDKDGAMASDSFVVTVTQQRLPFADGFETGNSGAAWGITANSAMPAVAQVVGSQAVSGTKSLSLQDAVASLVIDSSQTRATNVWVLVHLKATPHDDANGEPYAGVVDAGAVYLNTDGILKAYSGSAWVSVKTGVPLNTWLALACHLNYIARTWDLYVGTSVTVGADLEKANASPLPFKTGSTATRLESVMLDTEGVGYFDHIAAAVSTAPLGDTKVATLKLPAGTPATVNIPGFDYTYGVDNFIDKQLGSDLAGGFVPGDQAYVPNGDGFQAFEVQASGDWLALDAPFAAAPVNRVTGVTISRLAGAETYAFFPYTILTPLPAPGSPGNPLLTGRDDPNTGGYNLLTWPLAQAGTADQGFGFTHAADGDRIFLFTDAGLKTLTYNATLGYWREGAKRSTASLMSGQTFWYYRNADGAVGWDVNAL